MADAKMVVAAVPQSVLRQIHDAIDLLHASKLESAITLAHAAQGMLPKTDKPHLGHKLDALEKSIPEGEPGARGANDFATWLKHGEVKNVRYEKAVISEPEAIVAITRAISKYIAIYGGLSPKMGEFRDWAITRLQAQKD